jgi:hypothetical protein
LIVSPNLASSTSAFVQRPAPTRHCPAPRPHSSRTPACPARAAPSLASASPPLEQYPALPRSSCAQLGQRPAPTRAVPRPAPLEQRPAWPAPRPHSSSTPPCPARAAPSLASASPPLEQHPGLPRSSSAQLGQRPAPTRAAPSSTQLGQRARGAHGAAPRPARAAHMARTFEGNSFYAAQRLLAAEPLEILWKSTCLDCNPDGHCSAPRTVQCNSTRGYAGMHVLYYCLLYYTARAV